MTETTAELAASLSLAAARRIVEVDEFMKGGLYDGWLPRPSSVRPLLELISKELHKSLTRSLFPFWLLCWELTKRQTLEQVTLDLPMQE